MLIEEERDVFNQPRLIELWHKEELFKDEAIRAFVLVTFDGRGPREGAVVLLVGIASKRT
jgi:hypothetical protein